MTVNYHEGETDPSGSRVWWISLSLRDIFVPPYRQCLTGSSWQQQQQQQTCPKFWLKFRCQGTDFWHFLLFCWNQWQISCGQTGRPPPLPHLTKTYGWSWLHEAVCLRPGGNFAFKSFTFGHFFVWKWTKGFQLQWGFAPDPGLRSWPPPAPGSRQGLWTIPYHTKICCWRNLWFK